jgi:hypothetical protein
MQYDKTYVVDMGYYLDRKCKHPRTAIRDGRFKKDTARPTAYQHVCTRCGLVSNWNKMDAKGVCTITFPRVKGKV